MSNTQGVRDDKLRELIRIAEESGWRTTRSGSAHIHFYTPEGRFVAWCTTTKASPGAYYNTRAKLRRAGLEC